MLVSLCIIAYNEQDFLPKLLKDVLSQTYSKDKTEIILIDAISTDDTRKIMEDFLKENNKAFHNIAIIENKKKSQPSGWNVAIRHASGDVIIRVDAHAHIPCDFVSNNVICLQSGENISGGPRPNLILNETNWHKTLLLAESSMFGSSIASYRRSSSQTNELSNTFHVNKSLNGSSRNSINSDSTSIPPEKNTNINSANTSSTENKKVYVKTMFHAAYKKEVFEKCGLFNEQLIRTEDNELHYRMRKAGYKFRFDPSIISYQYTRSNLHKMLRQKFQNGFWIGLTAFVCPRCLSLFHFVPFAFILAAIASIIIACLATPLLFIFVWGAYWFANLAISIVTIIKNKANITNFVMPVLFFMLHISYGIGTLCGITAAPFKINKDYFMR